jgi:hypothetical protein
MASQDTVALHKDGYVDITISGNQTYLTYDQVHKDLRPILDELRKRNQPALGLVDFTSIGSFLPNTVKAGFEILSDVPYHKVAFFGASAALTEILNGIVLAIGRGDTTKTFATRNEALAWLLS